MSLQKQLVRLAYSRPDLRPVLLPLLVKEALSSNNFYQVYQIGGRSSVVLTRLISTPTPWYKKLGTFVSKLGGDAKSLVVFLKKAKIADAAKVIQADDALLMPASKGLYLRVFVEVPDLKESSLLSLVAQWGLIAGYSPQKKRF